MRIQRKRSFNRVARRFHKCVRYARRSVRSRSARFRLYAQGGGVVFTDTIIIAIDDDEGHPPPPAHEQSDRRANSRDGSSSITLLLRCKWLGRARRYNNSARHPIATAAPARYRLNCRGIINPSTVENSTDDLDVNCRVAALPRV